MSNVTQLSNGGIYGSMEFYKLFLPLCLSLLLSPLLTSSSSPSLFYLPPHYCWGAIDRNSTFVHFITELLYPQTPFYNSFIFVLGANSITNVIIEHTLAQAGLEAVIFLS